MPVDGAARRDFRDCGSGGLPMPALSVWDECVRVYGIPSRHPGFSATPMGGRWESRLVGFPGSSFLWLARTARSWFRELRASLVKTLCKWYSTVRGLINSWWRG